jgi:hypothetical protein
LRSKARSRSFFVNEAARSSSARASSRRPRRERKARARCRTPAPWRSPVARALQTAGPSERPPAWD